MSSAGSISAMIISIKNNQRRRKSPFEKLEKYSGYSTKTNVSFKSKVSNYRLRKIRENLIEQDRKSTRNKIITILILLIAMIYFIGFAKF